jgi:uncharacterized OB-fold protein
MAEPARAKPKPTPETQHFWDGTQAGELRLQRCDACANVYFPPRPFCPSCASRKVSVFKASGKATLYSYVINHRPAAPGFTPPYAIAVVELDEGPRMMSNIIDCPQTPEALELDMKLEVAFEKLDDKITLPLFRPRAKHYAQKCSRRRRRSRDHRPRRHPEHVADPAPCGCGAQRHRRCRTEALRHRRHRHPPWKPRSRSPIISASRRPGSTAPPSAAARSCCTSATQQRRSKRASARPC